MLLFFACSGIRAQQSLTSVKTQLDAMFAGLDKTKVPTGYLWDTAVNLVEGEGYNGSALTDSNFVTLPLMGDMLRSINSASVGSDTICVQAALSRIERNSSASSQMVGILFKPYNYIVANALTDNLISYSNDVVSDSYVNGVWQNPYGADVLYGYAMGNDATVYQDVTYTIANIDSLSTQSFQSIQFDPGDGQGFRTVSLGGTVVATYLECGIRETQLKVAVNGHYYISHGLVNVKALSVVLDSVSDSVATQSFELYFNNHWNKAMVTYKPPLCFDNPLIIAEGFDPWRLYDKKEGDPHSYSGFTDIHTILDDDYFDQFASGYNVFYVDWYDYGADIIDNAELFKTIINWINGEKTSGNPNVVMGQSMGGLIARYALRDMELHNQPHETRLFISHDAPYLGANVSPGLMFAYWDLYDASDNLLGLFYSLFGQKKKAFMELRRLGDYTSVKQLLTHYVDSDRNYNTIAYVNIQAPLMAMGFPKGDAGCPIENVAIVNGGNVPGGSRSYYTSGDELLFLDLHASTGIVSELLSLYFTAPGHMIGNPFAWIPGKTTLDFNYHVYPWLESNQVVSTSKLKLTKSFLWRNKKTYKLVEQTHYSPTTNDILDKVQSSSFHLNAQEYLPSPDTSNNVWWGDYTLQSGICDYLMFIPSASALAMPNGYNNDFSSDRPSPKTDTPFDGYIIQDDATTHIKFFAGISSWLISILNSSVVGPDIVFPGDAYSVIGPELSEYVFTWATSDSQIATINENTGVITTISRSGLVDVIAKCTKDGQVFTKKKTVLAGIPDMVITQSSSGNTYSAWTEIVSDCIREFAQNHGLDSLLTYNWYVDKWNTSLDHTIENLPQHADSVSFSLGTSHAYANIGLNVINGTDTLRVGPVSLRNADQFHINLYRIGYTNNQATFIYYPFGEIPLSMSEGGHLLILKPNTAASSIGFTGVIPSYATVAGQTFSVTPHPFETGYYVIDAFTTYEGDSLEHSRAVFNVYWSIKHDYAIIVRIYNSSGELLQTKSYVIDRIDPRL